MPVVRVLRTPDRRWRLEYLDSGLIDVVYLGHKILIRATVDQVGRRLAEAGVDPAGLVED